MNSSDTQWQSGSTSAVADEQEGFVNRFVQAESIKKEFQAVANSLARLGRKGRKEDVINLMAWEICDLRRAIARAAANRKECGQDEVR